MRNHIHTPHLLLLLLLGVAGSTACAGSVRIYDGPHHDYHRWNRHEDIVYRGYLSSQHRDYVDFKVLDGQEQNNYWAWRHDHPDR